jgi:hypothetical protein
VRRPFTEAIVSIAASMPSASGTKLKRRQPAASQTKPIDKPIPTGRKIAFISCGPASRLEFAKVLKPGADMLGWPVSTIATDGSPEKLTSAYRVRSIRGGS